MLFRRVGPETRICHETFDLDGNMQRHHLALGLLAIGICFSGCDPNSPPPSSPKTILGEPSSSLSSEPTSSISEPTATTKSEAKSDVPLDIKSWEETLALVAKHKGKVVVLDLWSTSCDPCKKEFPHLVEMHNKHGDKVVCMSASCDYVGIKGKPPESYKPQVLEFLTEQKATFQNILLNVESDVLFEKIELASIPAVYVFGTEGKQVKRFDNDAGGAEFTYEKEVVPFVEKLLAE